MKKWLIIIILSGCVTSKKLITLDGSKSYDKDGWIVKYEWRQIGKLKAIIVYPQKVTTLVELRQKGEYIFELLVVDNDGLVDRDTTIIIK